jgi:hypothetical protein
MKKLLIAAVAVLAVASISIAVTSQNVVGYNKKSTDAGELNMLGVPFNGTSSQAITNLFPDVPVGTRVYVFDDGYTIEELKIIPGPPPTFIDTTNWLPGTVTIDSTVGFWLEIPSGGGTETSIFSGEVADEDIDISIVPGLNLIHYPYPATVLLVDTALGQNPVVGDRVYKWDNAAQGYTEINEYKIIPGPPPTFIDTTNWFDTGMTLELGDAIWYQSEDTVTNVLTLTAPYTL